MNTLSTSTAQAGGTETAAQPAMPPSIQLTLPATRERPCILEINLSFRREYGGRIEPSYLAQLLLPKTRTRAHEISLCMGVDCGGERSYLDLQYHDPLLWIGGTRVPLDRDEAERIEETFAPHGLRIERKESAS